MSYNTWLYVYGNPINHTDPTGFDTWEGTQIHIMIENHYLLNYGAGREIIPNYLIPGASKEVTGYEGYADIADLTLHQIYEIKPIEYDLLGEQELYWYLAHLPANWKAGTNYPHADTYIGPWPDNPFKEVYAAMHIPGVIAYWGEDKRPNVPPILIPIPIPDEEDSKQKSSQPAWQPGWADLLQCIIDFLQVPTLPWESSNPLILQ